MFARIMKSILLLFNWIFNTPYRALDRAYEISKTIRRLQIEYVSYNYANIPESFQYNLNIYIDTVFKECMWNMYCTLLEFQISSFVVSFISPFFIKETNEPNILEENVEFLPKNIQFFRYFLISQKKHNKLATFQLRKLEWIEAVSKDLKIFDNKNYLISIFSFWQKPNINKNNMFSYIKKEISLKDMAYESIGLVPRSITRTLSRVQLELIKRSPSSVLPEFQLAKYQATASIQYILCLFLLPWIITFVGKLFIFRPCIENWWNTNQVQIFLNVSREERALTRLQEIEQLLWLDIVIASPSQIYLQDLAGAIHQKTLELADIYNHESIDTILNLFSDIITVVTVSIILIWGKKRLAILNSWIQEIFYSLSDTMKAFSILLFTDLSIGFHSPHGWEIFIASILEHLGFGHNEHIISCFVSTFPVILDTVFKYWIFRHLNRISPSIVVTYHTMNE